MNNRNGVIAERSSEKLPAWKPGGVGGPGAGPSGYVHQPIKVKPKDKDVFKMLGAIAHTRFKAKDALLREALYKFQDTPARSPEWALKVIDSVYKAVASQVSGG